MTLSERLEVALNQAYTRRLARDPATLAYFLSVSADAEGNGEGLAFEQTREWLEKHGHPRIAKLVATHAADEVRHEAMMRADIEKLGRGPVAYPAELKMIDNLGRRAGGIFDAKIENARDVAKAYLLLYAIERRAIERFGLMIDALEGVNPEIQQTFRSIAKDETSHLHYCVAVSRAALPDDAEWTKLRDEMVALEAEEFAVNSKKFMWFALDHVFETMSLPERLFWKTIRGLAALVSRTMPVLPIHGAQELPSGRISARNAISA